MAEARSESRRRLIRRLESRPQDQRLPVDFASPRPDFGREPLFSGAMELLKLRSHSTSGVLEAVNVDVVGRWVLLDRFDHRRARVNAPLVVKVRSRGQRHDDRSRFARAAGVNVSDGRVEKAV